MNITVNAALKAYIDPLTPDEHAALERSLLAEGCRDALVLWGDVLVDGHNRYGICQKHGLPFQTVQNTRFQSMADVHLWMIDQHLGRRSVSDFQRGVLALRKRAILTEQRAQASATDASDMPSGTSPEALKAPAHGTEQNPQDTQGNAANPLKSRADIAKAARLSSSQVVQIEKIQKQAIPQLVAAIKAGDISINAAAAVASLPAEEQRTAALGGKKQLRLAAKQVRDVTRKIPKVSANTENVNIDLAQDTQENSDASTESPYWRELVSTLTAENHALRSEVANLKVQLGLASAL